MEDSSLSHGASQSRVPYLALKHVAGSEHPIFFSISEKKVIDDVVEAATDLNLTNNNCWATPQGWILVRDASSATTYLLDPHSPPTDDTRKKIPLPHLPENNLSTYCTCLLSDYPAAGPGQESNNSTCVVLLVETDDPVIWYCRIDGSGEGWARHEYDIGTQNLGEHTAKEVICTIAACRGKFYFEGCTPNGGIGVLEFCPAPAFRSIAIRNAVNPGIKGFQKMFLVESKQELYMVSLMCGLDPDVVYRFSVHKMDFAGQVWHQVDDIGDRVFLLSSWYFGASRSADECGLQRNCLYVLYPWNKRLMILNLREPTTAKVLDFDEAPACDQALWMLPTHPGPGAKLHV